VRPLSGREVWRIGDWGGASGHIGRRWEEVGAAGLQALLDRPSPSQPDFVPRASISLVHARELEQAVQAAGLAHADAVLLGRQDGRVALQSVDFKWTLEVARPEQVAAETLQTVLEADLPPLRAALRAAMVSLGPAAETSPLEELMILDGLFITPDYGPNRAHLDVLARRRGGPMDSRQVVLAPVDGPAFFSTLPGWEMAEALAGLEGARRALQHVEGAEHYYRLGAGVLGALTAGRRSIFSTTAPQIDGLAELAALRRARRLTTLQLLLGHLDRQMKARAELVKKLNGLGRQLYPFSAFRTSLRAAGLIRATSEPGAEPDRRWSRLYGVLQKELAARLQREGQELVAAGQSDAEALASLAGRAARYNRLAAARATELIAAVQAGCDETG
jgi:hypothetical protein